MLQYGLTKAILTDVAAVLAQSLGWIKRRLLGRASTLTPHYIRDLVAHSVIWPKNRRIPALRAYATGSVSRRE